MLFDVHKSRQAQEIAFSCKKGVTNHGSNYFINISIVKENIQKHWGQFLYVKLNFLEDINDKIKKENKGINVIINSIITTFSFDNNLQMINQTSFRLRRYNLLLTQ